MNRVEIEIKLNRDRAWLVEAMANINPDLLYVAATPSEHDPSKTWSLADHISHVATVEEWRNEIFSAHFSGTSAPNPWTGDDGQPLPRDQILERIHKRNEDWAETHRGAAVGELLRRGLRVRASTLTLLAELTDEEIASVVPGTPWPDSTVGGIMAANAGHNQGHYQLARDGLVSQGLAAPWSGLQPG